MPPPTLPVTVPHLWAFHRDMVPVGSWALLGCLFVCLFGFCFVFDRLSLCSPGWPPIHNVLSSDPSVPALQVLMRQLHPACVAHVRRVLHTHLTHSDVTTWGSHAGWLQTLVILRLLVPRVPLPLG